MDHRMKQKLRTAVYGALIGDAMGVPYEFKERGSFQCTGMIGHGTHDQPVGTWSDDGAMILATCKSLKDNNGKVSKKDIYRKFKSWYEEGAFTQYGEVFDIGIATRRAIRTGKGQCGERDNGNGSLMRILPVAFTDCSDVETRIVSSITHGYWISTEACSIYVKIIRRCLQGEQLADVVHSLELEEPFTRIATIDSLPEEEINSGGYVVSSLEAAIWCVLTTNSFKDCLLKAVNLGSDTDTTACIAGGLAGACCYEFEDIPSEWIDAIPKKEIIEDCLF